MGEESTMWNFEGDKHLNKASACTIRSFLTTVKENLNQNDDRPVIPLGHGDPSGFPSFRTAQVAEDAVVDAVRSAKFNSYSSSLGIINARRAIAEYLSHDHPYDISPEDVFVTVGARQAIDVLITVLARPGANILLPRPGYPLYEARAVFSHLEIRHFDLLPEKAWEVDLNGLETLADDRTVAMVLVNPGNPCGNVYTHEHLQKIAETAKKLGFLIISDEAYGYLAFGSTPFVPMARFGSIVPVFTIGSLSKRWMVPGWRIGWVLTSDPNGILQKHKITECIKSYIDISADPSTIIQGALPQILKKTPESFHSKTLNLLREAADMCHARLKKIPCITYPSRPQGSMFFMVKLNLLLLKDINDDVEFCIKLAREESVIALPGAAVGLKNWLRITFAVELSSLEDGLERITAFTLRHAKTE
ncbi:tyrosine aminotransferase-like [Olea europaea subsp. europaea]|uniref:Tyrosine aminotransferase-like n=1 Tax=Olea europaea subsp. europaea TaxID=158383 RepID=A0A8S0PSP3_OLEEU|nr:tyrosine aminotransferase-like [Olea europaea subsp. europaea]